MSSELQVKKALRANLIIGSLGILIMGFQNCTTAQFSESADLSSLGQTSKQVSLSFDKSFKSHDANIDLIWLVDNSPSMAEETEIIRKNISDFIAKVEMRSNLRMALLSNSDTKYGVKLSDEILNKGHIQIKAHHQMSTALSNLASKLDELVRKDIIRENSQKIIIFTGDNDFSAQAGQIDTEEFLDSLQNVMNLKDVQFYSIVGLPRNSSCKIKQPGIKAIGLTEKVKGAHFDICKQDWSDSFNIILKDIAKLTQSGFQLPSKSLGNLVVKINGVQTDRFNMEGNSLILEPSNFPEESHYKIEVDYEVL